MIAGAAALVAAGILSWWMVWALAIVLLSAVMLCEDAQTTRSIGRGADAEAWGLLQAAGMIEQAMIASLATGAGLLAKAAAFAVS